MKAYKKYDLGEIVDRIDPPYVVVRVITIYENDKELNGSVQCCYSGGGFYDDIVWDTLEFD